MNDYCIDSLARKMKSNYCSSFTKVTWKQIWQQQNEWDAAYILSLGISARVAKSLTARAVICKTRGDNCLPPHAMIVLQCMPRHAVMSMFLVCSQLLNANYYVVDVGLQKTYLALKRVSLSDVLNVKVCLSCSMLVFLCI